MSQRKKPFCNTVVYSGRTNGESIALGQAIAREKRTLVFGGGSRGLMGAVSAACRQAGGKTLGIVPRAIAEGGGEGTRKDVVMELDPEQTIIVDSMHERKAIMAESAGAGFIGLPGGYGTLEEVRYCYS